MTTAIEVRGLGKEYFRGVHHGNARLLSDVVVQWGRGLVRWQRDEDRAKHGVEPFWALKNVSFTIEQGQVVGIIGRNGSGKSTLLRIIAQITSPTVGEVHLNGRTGTLLEVGTGFHPDLTGRENVFLNGAILGMSRAEIARKFDEIVEFSGVEAFLDTPVKRYSSGMQMRLAFSVAAHLDPEILIVDEVLAVGDAEFQKKCLGKMNEASKTGRTVLFVSHNMSAVDQLCDRAIWLDGGRIVDDSTDTYALTSRYLFGDREGELRGEVRIPEAPPLETDYFSFECFRVRDEAGHTVTAAVRNDTAITVEIGVTIKQVNPSLAFGYAVYNESGDTVYWSMMTDADDTVSQDLEVGRITLATQIPARFLNQGLYRLDFMAGLHSIAWLSMPGNTPHAVFLRIEGGLSDSVFWITQRAGVVAPVLKWRVVESARNVEPCTVPGVARQHT
jgi:lipopolysaccharide transport system ATP-binding protein